MRKRFWTLLATLLATTSATAVYAQADPVPNPYRINAAIRGAVEMTMIRRGFAANDPRFIATISRMSATLTSAARASAVVTAGAVTAPAWGSVAVSLGVGLVIGYAVDLAAGALVRWIFNADGTITQIQRPLPDGQVPNWYPPYKAGEPDTSPEFVGGIRVRRPDDALNFLRESEGSVLYFPAEGWSVEEWARPVRSGVYQNCYDGIAAGPFCAIIAPSQVRPLRTFQNADFATASKSLPASDLQQPLNQTILAAIANRAWSEAASSPDYAGVPFSVLEPVTETDIVRDDVSTPIATAPTVADFVAPQPVSQPLPGLDPAGSEQTDGGTSTNAPIQGPSHSQSPASNADSGYSLDPATTDEPMNNNEDEAESGSESDQEVDVDDPGIGAPALEEIPTAAQILEPLRHFFPSLQDLDMSAQHGECPQPSFQFGGREFVLKAQCDLIEERRDVISASFLAAFALLSILIVLRA
jgi:hypothetical protein